MASRPGGGEHGRNGDPVYDGIGQVYARHRRPDPRIAAQIELALGEVSTIVDVGAGTGSYEPTDKDVIAVEPSAVMASKRAVGAAPVVRAVAERLPFSDGFFDASLAVFTIHHWRDVVGGLREMARVARTVVILTFDPVIHGNFWLFRDYVPEVTTWPRTWCCHPMPSPISSVPNGWIR